MAAALPYLAGAVILNNIRSNIEKSHQAQDASAFYNTQAEYAAQVGARRLELLQQGQKNFDAKQTSMFAKAGISFSGSAVDFRVHSQVEMDKEQAAVRAETQNSVNAYLMRANAESQNASAYVDPFNQLAQNSGTILTYGAAKRGFE